MTAQSLPPGSEFGPYRVAERLESGASTELYRATHTGMGRTVDLRIFRDGPLHSAEEAARFRRELQLMVRVAHPNIVKLVDGEFAPDGLCYMATDPCPGETLAHRLGAVGRLPWITVCRIAIEMVSALRSLAALDIVHRNLKPETIVLQGDSVRIGAFGWARVVDSTRLTHHPVLESSLDHMAPEVLAGEEPTHAADAWSLGYLLYRSLAGLDAPHPRAVEDRLKKGGTPGVPHELEQLVWNMLDASPHKRRRCDAALELQLRKLLERGKSAATHTLPLRGQWLLLVLASCGVVLTSVLLWRARANKPSVWDVVNSGLRISRQLELKGLRQEALLRLFDVLRQFHNPIVAKEFGRLWSSSRPGLSLKLPALELIRRTGHDPDWLCRLSEGFAEGQDWEATAECLAPCLKEAGSPRSAGADSLARMAEAQFELDHKGEARNCARRAIELAQKGGLAHSTAMAVLAACDDGSDLRTPQRIADLSEVASLVRGTKLWLRHLELCKFKQLDCNPLELMRKRLTFYPHEPTAWELLATAHEDADRIPEALQVLEAAVTHVQDAPELVARLERLKAKAHRRGL